MCGWVGGGVCGCGWGGVGGGWVWGWVVGGWGGGRTVIATSPTLLRRCSPLPQAAAGPPVFKLLRDRLAVGFECFASPLNAAFARFGSAFPDVDGPFGSAGSFFK